jgi:asparagine synthase (glutamine-hydrolysing)
MCGICGFWTSGAGHRHEQLAMTDKLEHRGPDESGFHLQSVPYLDDGKTGTLGLGHRRLSIIDLSRNASQPMFNETRSVALIFNGEIYNFRDLRRDLLERGHRFVSKSDSEVIVHGYEEWGEAVFSKLNGMFACAVWDESARRLLLARDRVGIKPLYYYFRDGLFLFGSELQSLQAHSSFEAVLDLDSLGRYLEFSYMPAPRSIYRNTYKLLPGEYLVFENGSIRTHRYWDLADTQPQSETDLSYSEAAAQFESLLLDSVKKRLVSDVPLGVFLSGGYDSSLVVAIMKAVGTPRIDTFTVGFKEDRFNEAGEARAISEHIGTRHHELTVTPGETLAAMDELAALYDEPFGDPSALPAFLVSKFARDSGMTVALSGDGGDELFCGYPRYRSTNRLVNFLRLPSPLRQLGTSFLRNWSPGRIRNLGRNIDFDTLPALYRHRMSTWKDGCAATLVLMDGSKRQGLYFDEIFRKFNTRELMNLLSLVDIHTYMVDDILTKVDRASMAVSLEVRVPLLDHRIVEFAVSLPAAYKNRSGQGKRLLKTVSEKLIPPELLNRPKRGFAIPVEPWLKGPLKNLLLNELAPAKLNQEGLLRSDMVSKVVSGYMSGHYHCDRLIWSLLMLEFWLKRSNCSMPVEKYDGEKTQDLHADPELLAAGRRI